MSRAEVAPDLFPKSSLVFTDESQWLDPCFVEEPNSTDQDGTYVDDIRSAIDSIEGAEVPRSPSMYVEEPIIPIIDGILSAQKELHALFAIPCLTPEEQSCQIESLRKEWNLGMLAFRSIRLTVLKERVRVTEVARAALAPAV